MINLLARVVTRPAIAYMCMGVALLVLCAMATACGVARSVSASPVAPQSRSGAIRVQADLNGQPGSFVHGRLFEDGLGHQTQLGEAAFAPLIGSLSPVASLSP